MSIFGFNFFDRRAPRDEVPPAPSGPVVEEKEGFTVIDKRGQGSQPAEGTVVIESETPADQPDTVVAAEAQQEESRIIRPDEGMPSTEEIIVPNTASTTAETAPATITTVDGANADWSFTVTDRRQREAEPVAVETAPTAERQGVMEQARQRGESTLGNARQRLGKWFRDYMPTLTKAVTGVSTALREGPNVMAGLSGMAQEASAQKWREASDAVGEKYMGMRFAASEIQQRVESGISTAVENGSRKVADMARNSYDSALIMGENFRSKGARAEAARIAVTLDNLAEEAQAIRNKWDQRGRAIAGKYDQKREALKARYLAQLEAIKRKEAQETGDALADSDAEMGPVESDMQRYESRLEELNRNLQRYQQRREQLLAKRQALMGSPESMAQAA